MPLPRADEPGPHRHRTETMDQPLEGRVERIRDHLRRTPVRRPYLDPKISYTKFLTDPSRILDTPHSALFGWFVWGVGGGSCADALEASRAVSSVSGRVWRYFSVVRRLP